MQAWLRQPTQCIFCAFRQATSRPIPLRRGFKTTPTYTAEKQRRKTSRSDLDNSDSRRRDGRGRRESLKGSPESQNRKKSDGSPLIRRTAGGGPDWRMRSQGNEEIQDAIKRSLSILEKRLHMEKSTQDGDRSQMQLLDPSGRSWQAYRSHVESLGEKVRLSAKVSKSDEMLWNLLSLTSARRVEGLEKELYFGFLDFTLKPLNTTELHDAATMPVDLRYPTEWYANARKNQRVIHLHVGPTNSGKTYHALKRLQEVKNGFYAGPLRLLAHEVYSRFRANNIPCDLITGDDVRIDPNGDSSVYTSTVEMVDCSREVEVAVIDEIQMMGSEDRGWAWTRAFLGASAKEVHLCGEARVVPLIRELAASMGDTLHIHNYQRLNPLRCMAKSLRGNLKSLRKGDCIVAFSVVQIHALKKQIELETGRGCAIVYGSLPPETRAAQADLFNDPDNEYDYLVASDAIGMGLNLSVKRIIFNSVHKWDGTQEVQLAVPQIKQIAGRAGRFRTAHQDKSKQTAADIMEDNVGLVTCLDEADLPIIRAALETEAPPLRKAGIIPPAEYLQEYSSQLPPDVPFEYLMRKVCHAATIHPRFFLCDVRDKLVLARITDDVPGLTIEQRVNITAAPLGGHGRDTRQAACLRALARAIATNTAVTVADLPEMPLEILMESPHANRTYLEGLENLHKCLIMYLWLSYRFPTTLRDQPMAVHAKDLTEQKINWTLRAFSANPNLRARLKKLMENQKVGEAASSASTPGTSSTEPAQHASAIVSTETSNQIYGQRQEQHEFDQPQPTLDGETVEEHFNPPSSDPLLNNVSAPQTTGTGLDIAGHEDEWEERPAPDTRNEQLFTPSEEAEGVETRSEVHRSNNVQNQGPEMPDAFSGGENESARTVFEQTENVEEEEDDEDNKRRSAVGGP